MNDTTHDRDAQGTGSGANGHDTGTDADETMAWTGDTLEICGTPVVESHGTGWGAAARAAKMA